MPHGSLRVCGGTHCLLPQSKTRSPVFLVAAQASSSPIAAPSPSPSPHNTSSELAIMAAEAEEQAQETPQKEIAEEKEEAPAKEEEAAPAAEEEKEEEAAPAEEEEAPAEEEEEPEAEAEEEEEVEEPVDPKPSIEDGCKPKCVKQLLAYQACESRIEEDEDGQKHCTGQYFDYWGCIDKCAAPKLFRKLK